MSYIKKILKKIMPQQNYEDYWKITVEYTDIHGERFNGTLQLIVDYIDNNDVSKYTPKLFDDLQNIVDAKYPKVDKGSIRKSINQFVKLGYINYELKSYHQYTKPFLEAKTKRRRHELFSRILYSNSSLNRSVTENSDTNEINFLIKTLEEVGKLTKKDIEALMLVNISDVKKGYLNSSELNEYKKEAKSIDFKMRKYNQVAYLFNFLNKLNDVVFVNDELYFEEDAKHIFGDDYEDKKTARDPYLHRIYKVQLQEECEEIYGNSMCVLEQLSYPILIASHIKPFIESDENEAYDPNNGLLLSRTIDSLFDGRKGKPPYISFNDDGTIIFSERLAEDVKEFWKDYQLENIVLNDERKEYLAYHRALMN